MRFRRWLYVVAGLYVTVVSVGAMVEQATGLYLRIGRELWFDYMSTWYAYSVAVLVAPIALYDYLRWLFRRHTHLAMRLAGVAVLGVGFWIGFSMTGWDGCVTEIGPMDGVSTCSKGALIGLGLVLAFALALGFWAMTRDRSAPDEPAPAWAKGATDR